MNVFEEAWKNIVSPTQIKSKPSMLGPWERSINGVVVKRTDLVATNRNGKRIQGFLFRPQGVQTTETLLYLHGNGGCKLEALPLVEMVVEFGFSLTAFDMLGCGNSDSGLLTYGVNEVFDIRDMLEEVRKHTTVGRVTIWGRSMGSLCALMFANTYAYEVSALILDSPFRSLREVVQRIAEKKVQVPSWLLRPLLYFVQQRASEEVGVDIFQLDYLTIMKRLNANLPILFVFSNFDSIVPAQEVLQFYNAYHGPKDLCEIYRTHDEDRPDDLFRQGIMWLTRSKKKNMKAIVQAREHLVQKRKQEQERSRSQANRSHQHSRFCSTNCLPSRSGFFCQ